MFLVELLVLSQISILQYREIENDELKILRHNSYVKPANDPQRPIRCNPNVGPLVKLTGPRQLVAYTLAQGAKGGGVTLNVRLRSRTMENNRSQTLLTQCELASGEEHAIPCLPVIVPVYTLESTTFSNRVHQLASHKTGSHLLPPSSPGTSSSLFSLMHTLQCTMLGSKY